MLFGHQNDNVTQPADTPPAALDPALNPLATDPTTGASLPVALPQPLPDPLPTPVAEPTQTDQPTVVAPLAEDSAATAPVVDPMLSFSTSPPASIETPPEAPTAATTPDTLPTSVDQDLIGMKQQALQQLTPLVGHLDQSPEEKFRTTMMLIQSTDNQTFLKDAYDAAQAIPDEKARAQALLDVINEINYFTQQKPAQ